MELILEAMFRKWQYVGGHTSRRRQAMNMSGSNTTPMLRALGLDGWNITVSDLNCGDVMLYKRP